MAFMKGEALIAKVAAVAKYGILPGAMIVALIYSPPPYALKNDKSPSDGQISHLFFRGHITMDSSTCK